MKNRIQLKLAIYLALCIQLISINVSSQVSVCSNVANNNGNGKITFNFQNTNAYAVIITDISSICSTTTLTATEAWYRPNALAFNGAAAFPALTAANWTQFGNATISGVASGTSTTPQSFFNGALNLVVPAGATYGICINAAVSATPTTGNLRYSTLTAGVTYTTSGGGCNMISGGPSTAGASAGGGPRLASTTFANYPRGFVGCVSFVPAIACSGTPNAGSASISVSAGCPSSAFSLTTTGLTTGTGITYQWQSSSSPTGPWTDITGATNPSLTTSVLATTYFQLVTTCSNSGSTATSNVVSYTVNNPGPCICGAYPSIFASSAADEEITNVTVGSMNNSSTCSVAATGPGSILNRYSNYSGVLSGPVEIQGNTVNFSLTQTSCGGAFGNFFQIYVDWNQDGDWLDAGEQVYTQPASVTGNHTVTGTFTVPLTSIVGTTRMRVVVVENTASTINYAHTAYTWGETEDYCFTVIAPTPCSGTPNAGVANISPTSACPGSNFSLSASGLTSLQVGLSYQWQSSNSPTGPWTNIPSATNTSYSANGVNTTTYYQIVTTCSSSGLSNNSSVATASLNAAPTITLTPSNSGYFCGAPNQTISAGGADTYTWSPGASLNVTTGPLVTSNVSTPTTYTVVGTNTTTGCSSTQTITVGPPAISVSSTTSNFCGSGGSFTLTATSPADPNMSYTWANLTPSANFPTTSGNVVSGSITETSNFQVTGAGSGTFAGCSSVQFVSIGVYPLPSASLTATPDQVCPGGSSVINTGLSAGNFSAICITPNPVTIPANASYLANNGVATVPLTSGVLDDGGWGNIPLGFSFNFFGTNYTSVNVGTNGVLQFGPYNATALGDYIIGALPNTLDPLGAIFLAANDLNCGTPGTPGTYVRYWTDGYAPNRKFIIEYNVFQFGSTTNRVNIQAILYETLGNVDIVAMEVASTNSKSVGVNSPTGLIGASAPNCAVTPNAANYWSGQIATIPSSAPQAWRFSPPSNYTTVWTATDINGTTTIANGTNIFTQTVTPAVSTNYSISYTNQTTGCTNAAGSAQVQMNVLTTNPPVGLNSISTATLVCVNANFDLSTSYSGPTTGLTFQWQASTDGGLTWNNIAAATTPSVTTSQSVTTQYRCEIASCGGTAGYSSAVTVTLQNPPALAVSSSAAGYCSPGGTPVALNITGTTANYAWTPSAGLSSTSGSSVFATPSSSTIYTVTATDSVGCTNFITVSVNSSPGIIFNSLTASDSSICSGTSVNLSANAVSGQAPAGYCQPSYSTGTTFGDYIGLVQLGNINNATVGAPAPYYTLYPPSGTTTTTLTAGSTYTLTLQAGTYTLNDLAAFIDYNQNVVLNDTLEKLGETNDLGAAPAQTTIVFTVPLTALNGPTILRVRELDGTGTPIDPCSSLSPYGEVEDYVVTIVGGVDPVINYSWSPSTFLTSTNTPTTTASSMTNSVDYIVTATSANGCQVSDTINITVNALPTTPIISDTVICSGNSTTLATSGIGTISWYDAPTGGNFIASGNSYSTPVLSNSVSYYVQDSTAGGCASLREQVDVTVNPTPVVSLGPDSTQCGSTITLDALNAGANFLWNTQQNTQTLIVDSTGLYHVAVTNSFNCTGYDSVNITINYQPVINLGNDSTHCANSLLLDAQNSGNIYQWNTGDTTQTLNVSASGSYDVVVSTIQGCVGYDTVNLVLNPAPIVNLGGDTSLCGGSIILDAQNTGSTYLWSDNSSFPIIFVSTTGTYWVDVTNPQNCTTRDSINITVSNQPLVSLGQDVNLCTGDSVTLDAGSTVGATYLWSDSSSAQTLSVDSTGLYFVNVTTGPGCSASDTIQVTVYPYPAPNIALNLGVDTVCSSVGIIHLTGESPAGGTFSGNSVSGSNFDASVGAGTYLITYTITD
ncbi:MAG: GEVED domain-containing protein, partial [Bacteroidota bacterium]